MTATVALCVISSLTFCFCVRLLIGLADSSSRPAWAHRSNFNIKSGPVARFGLKFSGGARRVGRQYAIFAIGSLTLLAGVGTVRAFIDLGFVPSFVPSLEFGRMREVPSARSRTGSLAASPSVSRGAGRAVKLMLPFVYWRSARNCAGVRGSRTPE